MDEIPADVLKAALECWLGMEEVERIPVEPVPAIARAIMAERERCAKIARNFSRDNAGNMPLVDAGFSISRAIRGNP